MKSGDDVNNVMAKFNTMMVYELIPRSKHWGRIA
ncbi:hypothetical protein J2Y67_002386 [Neobacillus niacini]|nr:hypothetical protein [Neobacillus niacini]